MDVEREDWSRAWSTAEARLRLRLESAFAATLAWCCEPAALLAQRSSPGTWTPVEVLEHVTLANRFLSILIQKIAQRCEARLAAGASYPAHPPHFEHLETLARRDFGWLHPEHMSPTAGPPPEQLAATLGEQRDALLALLAALDRGRGSLHRIRMSVVPTQAQDAEGDRLDLGQYLLVLTLHLERHLGQLERLRGDWLAQNDDPAGPRFSTD